MIFLIKSTAGKFVLIIGLICMILSAYKYYNFLIVLAKYKNSIPSAKTIKKL